MCASSNLVLILGTWSIARILDDLQWHYVSTKVWKSVIWLESWSPGRGGCRNRDHDDLIGIPSFSFYGSEGGKKDERMLSGMYVALPWLAVSLYSCHKEVFGPKFCCCSDSHVTGSVLNFCKRSCQWFMRLLFPQQIASFCRALRHILPTVWGRRNGCVVEPTYHGQKVADFQRSQC